MSTEEFEYFLGKINQEGYQRGYQQGQKDVLDKQEAERTYLAGAPEVARNTQAATQTGRAVPRPPVASPQPIPDDDIPF